MPLYASPQPWSLPDVLYRDEAATLLKEYFFARDTRDPSLTAYTGAVFEQFPVGVDRLATANIFTSDDLLAVNMLSVDVPAQAAILMLGPDADRLSQLLAQIPHDLDLAYADPEHIDEGSASRQLWELVRSYRGIGQTRASKLLARKRPRLFPVIDSVVKRALGHSDKASFWQTMRHHLSVDDRALHRQLLNLRDEAGLPENISALRVFDVVVWMKYR